MQLLLEHGLRWGEGKDNLLYFSRPWRLDGILWLIQHGVMTSAKDSDERRTFNRWLVEHTFNPQLFTTHPRIKAVRKWFSFYVDGEAARIIQLTPYKPGEPSWVMKFHPRQG